MDELKFFFPKMFSGMNVGAALFGDIQPTSYVLGEASGWLVRACKMNSALYQLGVSLVAMEAAEVPGVYRVKLEITGAARWGEYDRFLKSRK